MRNSTSFADSLVELISGQVQEAINETDLSDQIEEAISNSNEIENQVEKHVESAMDDLDIDDKVKDEVENYDFSDAIETVLKDNYDFKQICSEVLEEDLDELCKTVKFIDMVDAIVQLRLQAIAAAKYAKFMDYVKFGPLVRAYKAGIFWTAQRIDRLIHGKDKFNS